MTTCNICGGIVSSPDRKMCTCGIMSEYAGTSPIPPNLKALQDLAAEVMKSSRPMTVDEHEIRNQFIKKEFADAPPTPALVEEMYRQAKSLIETLESKLTELREQRENYKTIAEEASAMVKEQEDRIAQIIKILSQVKNSMEFSPPIKSSDVGREFDQSNFYKWIVEAYDSACGKGKETI